MRFAPLTLSAAICVAAFTLPGTVSAQETVSRETVLATVNGTDITLGHLIVLRSGLPPQYAQLDPQTLFDGLLNQLVQQTLLAQSLENGPSPQVQLMVENESRALIASEAIGAIVEGAVSEAAIQSLYEERYLDAAPTTEYSAAHILLETEEDASRIVEQLNNGADFSQLARDFSQGPSGPNGGDLGWFAEGVMVQPFFDAVVALSPGDVSPPVQTDFGWHVILLKETRTTERPELEETRAEIEDILRNEALDAELERLEQDGDVDRPDLSRIDPTVLNDPSILER